MLILYRKEITDLPKSVMPQMVLFLETQAGVAQLVEHNPSKVRVASSNLVSRSSGRCSSGVERFLGKEEVMGSIPILGSK